jgi:hypothetical protein
MEKFYDHQTKVSVKIDEDIYRMISKNLRYGQLTALFRQFFGSLAIVYKEKGFKEILLYINNLKELTLPRIKNEYKNKIDEKN